MTPLDPLSPPPPNITRLGDVWDHRTRFNVRRGGRERRKMGKNRVLPLGLIHKVQTKPAPKVNDSQRASRCRLRHDAAVHARGAARSGGWSAHGGSRRGQMALWRAAPSVARLWANDDVEICRRCQHVQAHCELGGYDGSVGTQRHYWHARLSWACSDSLRGHAIARAIDIAEAQWWTVAAVAVAEQLSSAAWASSWHKSAFSLSLRRWHCRQQ